MKFAIAFAAIIAVGSAQFSTPIPYQQYRPTPSPPPRVYNNNIEALANTVEYLNEINPDGSFRYVVKTDNGIAAEAQGTPRDFGGNPPVIPVVVQGSFAWTSPEGQPIVIEYKADENGYQATGDAIPTPPAIPAAILRSLEYIAKNAPKK